MVKNRNEQEVLSRTTPFSWKGEYDANENIEYEGWAAAGATLANPVWMAAKHTYDANQNITQTEWAVDSAGIVGDFTNIGTDLSALTYQ